MLPVHQLVLDQKMRFVLGPGHYAVSVFIHALKQLLRLASSFIQMLTRILSNLMLELVWTQSTVLVFVGTEIMELQIKEKSNNLPFKHLFDCLFGRLRRFLFTGTFVTVTLENFASEVHI
jgi:hypothetical protein